MSDSFLGKLFKYKLVKIFFSFLIGFGIASLFRRQCKHNNCVDLKSPDLKYIKKNTFKQETSCYQYNPYLIQCPNKTQHHPESAYVETPKTSSRITNEVTLSSFNK